MDPLFDHEKLDVYCVELGFVAWIAAFLDDASHWSAQHRRELIEQLDRALEAAVGTTNTAIGTNEARLENSGVYFRLERSRRDKKGLLPRTRCNG
jgi:hypothetical protein